MRTASTVRHLERFTIDACHDKHDKGETVPYVSSGNPFSSRGDV